MDPSHATNAPLDGATAPELAVAEAIGRLMHFWGFKRPMGRAWAFLYLHPTPLTATDLAQGLKMSAGAVSMALAELEKWGAVHRSWMPGDRRDFFSAETDIWQLVQRVMRQRELLLIREFTQALEQADSSYTQAEVQLQDQGSNQVVELQRLEYKRARVKQLRHLSETGETLLGALVAGAPVNPSALLAPTAPSKSKAALRDQ